MGKALQGLGKGGFHCLVLLLFTIKFFSICITFIFRWGECRSTWKHLICSRSGTPRRASTTTEGCHSQIQQRRLSSWRQNGRHSIRHQRRRAWPLPLPPPPSFLIGSSLSNYSQVCLHTYELCVSSLIVWGLFSLLFFHVYVNLKRGLWSIRNKMGYWWWWFLAFS